LFEKEKSMSPHEQLFHLMHQVLELVVKGTVTVHWLNDCLRAIIKRSRQKEPEVVALPPRAFPEKNRGGRKAYLVREVASWELDSDDWEIIVEFCRNKNPRFLPLAEYFRINNNSPTSREVLKDGGFVFPPFATHDFQTGVNIPFWRLGLNYALRGPGSKRHHTRGKKEEELRFCRLRVVS
jgi:hypothetical protein